MILVQTMFFLDILEVMALTSYIASKVFIYIAKLKIVNICDLHYCHFIQWCFYEYENLIVTGLYIRPWVKLIILMQVVAFG